MGYGHQGLRRRAGEPIRRRKEPSVAKGLIARASISVRAARNQVWRALLDAGAIEQHMFGTRVVTDWKEGSPILWKGTWNGRAYEDKGVVLRVTPRRTLRFSHFSPLSELPDNPENYHTVTIKEALAHSEKNWGTMLTALKDYLESSV
jgi:hypothetical protein